ncbi:polysaccharide deacetylase [Mycobacterium sp. ITM-2016-00316]|uniref:polysaccharide deacetylase family protein n=1 Tax=Mycobacterium sp. ITM-2016-00316 TaxID=2099695 RepID=UPI000CF93FD9|nr:polysaccharide deacetylase [Mycobacterium sp. ITM-2016-00316]WNG79601.1 polysaccharide deacetylase [Mycobacterium sp. ITM-2016-00316]
MTALIPAGPVQWPDGKTCAVAFTFDVDAESPLLTTDPAFADRMGAMSHQAYGPLVGIPRLLRILEEIQIPATFFVPGYTAHRHPEPIRSIVQAGHEIAHHGYLHESLVGVDEDTERDYLVRGIAALEEVAGVTPVGYRAPMWEMNWHTPKLLAEFNFLYDSTLMDSDHPYELAVTDDRSLVELPVSWALDDWQQYCFVPDFSGTGLIETPAKTVELYRSELDAMRDVGGAWILTNHPFLSGRPGRAAALREFMADVRKMDDVWIASMAQIAQHVRSQQLTPRTITRPEFTPTVRSIH